MSKIEPIYTKKQLKALIRDVKSSYSTVVDYSPNGELFSVVRNMLGENPQFIIDEIIAGGMREVVNEDSRVDLDREPDFFGYGEKWIKLPEQKTVQVEFASLDHVMFQKGVLIENHMRQIKAFLRHHDDIVVPIIATMKDRDLKTAGEALKILRGE